jgi:hypothetical protein
MEMAMALTDDIRRLQTRVGVTPDGKIGSKTIAAINAALDMSAPQPVSTSGFSLSLASMEELRGVHPRLRQCVELAITYCKTDFRVLQGLRTVEEQRRAVAAGNSRTMKSKHLPQVDGHAWAVDLAVLTSGKVDWTFERYAEIAYAMDRAATELGIAGHIRWGCAWDRVLSDFGGDASAYLQEAHNYAQRHAGSDLLDAPHFEWVA